MGQGANEAARGDVWTTPVFVDVSQSKVSRPALLLRNVSDVFAGGVSYHAYMVAHPICAPSSYPPVSL
jgi:hypothetical protein